MPNIDETAYLPKDNLANLQGRVPPELVSHLEQLHNAIMNMYQTIARGVNETYTLKLLSSSTSGIPTEGFRLGMLPSWGSWLIIAAGTQTDMPTKTVLAQKNGYNATATLTTLGSVAGVNAWTGVNIVFGTSTSGIGIAHDGATSLKEDVQLTVIGAYPPET